MQLLGELINSRDVFHRFLIWKKVVAAFGGDHFLVLDFFLLGAHLLLDVLDLLLLCLDHVAGFFILLVVLLLLLARVACFHKTWGAIRPAGRDVLQGF